MMTTFSDLLATFEQDLVQYDQVMAEPIPEERECTGCNEVWPLDSDFFHKNRAKLHGFDTRCKACVAEARDLNKPKPVVSPSLQSTARLGTLSLFVPKGETKLCVCCEKAFPLSGAFWVELERGQFSGNCLTCISFASKNMNVGAFAHVC
jgi:hypothetical protein